MGLKEQFLEIRSRQQFGEDFYKDAFYRDFHKSYLEILKSGEYQIDGPDHFISKQAVQYVLDEAWEENLVLSGKKTGTGKTFDIWFAIWHSKKNFYYVQPSEIIRLAISAPREIESMKNYGYLFIDDIDHIATGSNEISFSRNIIHEILSHRYSEGLPTLITSNCTVEELEKIYTQYIARRIFENTKYQDIKD